MSSLAVSLYGWDPGTLTRGDERTKEYRHAVTYNEAEIIGSGLSDRESTVSQELSMFIIHS